ncbi:MAG: efflux RND transporter periplasmic adaptor subunit [Janthinobacterium lividum]
MSGARATLAGTQATLTGSAAALQNARQGLARVLTLYSDGLVAQKDVEAARLAVQTAAAQAAAQQQSVDAQRETVRSQQLALLAAEAARLQNIVKQKDVEVAQQQVKNAKGALATLRAQAALYTIHSPLTGTVFSIGASLGENVDTAAKLITVVNLDTLQLQIAVPAEAARQVHVGQPVSFRVDGLPGKVFMGAVSALTTQVDPASNTVQAFAVIRNPRHELADDAYAKVQITVQKHSSALLIPQGAVLRDAGGQVNVVVVGADTIAHLKEVKTGLTQGGIVEILSGIQPGERVVTTGSYGLPDGTNVTVAEGNAAP